MDNLTTARNQPRAMREATREPHTWIMSFLYIGTFGSFIGFGFAFGQVLQNQFTGRLRHAAGRRLLTWLGPLLGSLIRPVGGSLADRFGGARITFWNFVAMASAPASCWTPPRWSRCRCSSSASCCCSCSAASATARPTR
jgi:NNP family nitrate/nitrite transporter-like MFS transporter